MQCPYCSSNQTSIKVSDNTDVRECFSCGKKFREGQTSNDRPTRRIRVPDDWNSYTYTMRMDWEDLPFSDERGGGVAQALEGLTISAEEAGNSINELTNIIVNNNITDNDNFYNYQRQFLHSMFVNNSRRFNGTC